MAERRSLLERATKVLLESTDRFVLYTVPRAHEQNISVLGTPRPAIESRTFYIV